jgi:hypothetical protein
VSIQIAAHYTRDTRINNGLHSIQQELLDDPDTRRVAVCIVEVVETGERIQDGHKPFVKVNLFAIEPLHGDDALEARTIMERAVKARTGQPHAPTLFDAPYVGEGEDDGDDRDPRLDSPDNMGDGDGEDEDEDEDEPRANRHAEVFSDADGD